MAKSSSMIPETKARRPRWRPQFRLRTLLILVALVAIVLGLWVQPAEQQRRAIQTLRRAGAAIHYRPKDPDSRDSHFLVAGALIARTEYLAALESNRRSPGAMPQALIDQREAAWREREQAIANQNRPSWLPGWLLPDEWFQHVEAVDLTGCQVKDELSALANLPGLAYLNLDRSSVTDANVHDLSLLKSLRTLSLRETEVSDEGERELPKALPHCTIWR